jgi:hypothetical protein
MVTERALGGPAFGVSERFHTERRRQAQQNRVAVAFAARQ